MVTAVHVFCHGCHFLTVWCNFLVFWKYTFNTIAVYVCDTCVFVFCKSYKLSLIIYWTPLVKKWFNDIFTCKFPILYSQFWSWGSQKSQDSFAVLRQKFTLKEMLVVLSGIIESQKFVINKHFYDISNFHSNYKYWTKTLFRTRMRKF